MTTKKIISKAPTRLDLAGGTLDIWPLYTYLNHPTTINVGIDLFAEVELTATPVKAGSGRISLRSGDQNKSLAFGWNELGAISAPPALDLHLRLLRHFATKAESDPASQDLTLSTTAKSPAGAGLGGSSTLAVALIGALGTWASDHEVDPGTEGEHFVDVARDIETTVIQVPAGVQDYYGAMFGGLQSLRWGVGVHDRVTLPDAIREELQKRLIVFYSGQSRNSGINNWALFKAFIDAPATVRPQFQAISDAAVMLERALLVKDWDKAGQAIAEEWKTRRTLAPGITTPAIERAFSIGRELGATAGKVCGAGGGGCYFLYVPSADESVKSRIRDRICGTTDCGSRYLPFSTVPHGVEARLSRA